MPSIELSDAICLQPNGGGWAAHAGMGGPIVTTNYSLDHLVKALRKRHPAEPLVIVDVGQAITGRAHIHHGSQVVRDRDRDDGGRLLPQHPQDRRRGASR